MTSGTGNERWTIRFNHTGPFSRVSPFIALKLQSRLCEVVFVIFHHVVGYNWPSALMPVLFLGLHSADKWRSPLMGWLAAADTLRQVWTHINVETREDAIRIAERNGERVNTVSPTTATSLHSASLSLPLPGWPYEVMEPPNNAVTISKSYAYNFLPEVMCAVSSTPGFAVHLLFFCVTTGHHRATEGARPPQGPRNLQTGREE